MKSTEKSEGDAGSIIISFPEFPPPEDEEDIKKSKGSLVLLSRKDMFSLEMEKLFSLSE